MKGDAPILFLVLYHHDIQRHAVMRSSALQTSSSGVELWRWMYFFAAWPVLWVAVSAATNYGFRLLEWLFFRCAALALSAGMLLHALLTVFMPGLCH